MIRTTTSRREFLETIGGASAVAAGTLATLGGRRMSCVPVSVS
jgi:hypothetical protein